MKVENIQRAYFEATVADILWDQDMIDRQTFKFKVNGKPFDYCLHQDKEVIFGDRLTAGTGSEANAITVFETICETPIADTIVFEDSKPAKHWDRQTELAQRRYCGGGMRPAIKIIRGPGRHSK